ncbi:MAG TPA: ankyrin repeat domain-containing protein [Fimbriimonadaceae bacterium]|nr:ankyrin repeat domain-containing protein [Fimbriimonadaceae bacterium]
MDSQTFLKAVSDGDRAAVAEALAANPSLANERSPDGASAIQRAVYYGCSELVEDILAAGAEVDLATACTIGKSLPPDFDPNELSADGFRPIALAAAFGHNGIVRILLAKGADPNLPSTALGAVPPLQSAVFGRNLEAVRLFVEAGAEVDAKQQGGFTALMGASQNGDAEMVRYLLASGANPHLLDNGNKSAADWAANEEVRATLTGTAGAPPAQ